MGITIEEMRALCNGDKPSRARPRHLEDRLQISIVEYWDLMHPDDKKMLAHFANGGRRNAIEAAKFKKMGVRPGIPDLILLIPNKHYPFMGIELKTSKGTQSEYQKQYQSEFERRGYKYVVVRSLDEFIKVTNEYLADR